jgi:hypothetical protein
MAPKWHSTSFPEETARCWRRSSAKRGGQRLPCGPVAELRAGGETLIRRADRLLSESWNGRIVKALDHRVGD